MKVNTIPILDQLVKNETECALSALIVSHQDVPDKQKLPDRGLEINI